MKSFIAMDCKRNTQQGGYYGCLVWASKSDNPPVKIYSIRAGEKNAKIVAEVEGDLVRVIHSGRIMPIKSLRKYLTG